MNKKDDLGRFVDIFRHLKAVDIMTKSIATLTPDKKMSQAKEMMRIKKVSGIPIVDNNSILKGIISIEDIIVALEEGSIDKPISSMMTTDIITLSEDDSLTSIVEKFKSFKLGRFPVVDNDNRIIGVISRVDILHGILDRFKLIYIHDQNRTNTLGIELSQLNGERMDNDDAGFNYSIDNSDITLAGTGAAMLKQFLKKECNIDQDICRRAGIATYEAETNVVIHSKSKGNIYCFVKDDSVIIRVIDNGIGIEDLDKAMIEGFSTASDYVREYGFGAGMGIPNMNKFADKLVILSEKNVGTSLEMVFFLNKES